METKEMRVAYTEKLIAMASDDKNIVVLESDLMRATGTGSFRDKFPERTFNVGVAEANMVGVAAGLAAGGKKPWAATFACFAARRAYDQFFISGNYARLSVHLVGTDPGISAEYNGGTHMPFEDIGLMRCIPQVVVCEPSDAVSLQSLMEQLTDHQGSTYLRLHRKVAPVLYSASQKFTLGKGHVLRQGNAVALLATGAIMVNEALKAADILAQQGVDATVVDMHTIKPLDTELVLALARRIGCMVTCENHQVIGGLGAAVCEFLSENCPIPVKRVGVRDEFGSVGTLDYLQEHYGLSAKHIVAAALEVKGKKL